MGTKALYAADDYPEKWVESTVEYEEKSEVVHELATVYPSLLPTGGKISCVPTAGGNIVFYYDRFFPNLIPNFEPGKQFGDKYMYGIDSPETQQVMEKLYDYMGTDDEGTSISEFQRGLSRYVLEKGYSASFTTCMTMGRFLYNTGKSYLDKGNPLALFLSVFNVTLIQEYENFDFLQTYVCEAPHAMVAFGYREITYRINNSTRWDRYLAVAGGIAGHESGYFNILYDAKFDQVLAVTVS